MMVEVELTKEDIINFNLIQQQRRHSQARPAFWKNFGIWFAISIILVFLFEILTQNVNFDTIPQNVKMMASVLMGSAGVVAVLMAVLIIFWKPHLKFQLKRMLTEHSLGVGKYLYTVSEVGLNETTANAEGLTKWTGIIELVKNVEYILLYTADNAACIFPTRCFQTPEEMQRFINQVEQWTHLEMITLGCSHVAGISNSKRKT